MYFSRHFSPQVTLPGNPKQLVLTHGQLIASTISWSIVLQTAVNSDITLYSSPWHRLRYSGHRPLTLGSDHEEEIRTTVISNAIFQGNRPLDSGVHIREGRISLLN